MNEQEGRLTDEELSELEELDKSAFRGPWTYEFWEIDCRAIGLGEDCGLEHNIATVLAPEEYPNDPDSPQVVAQIDVPGLESFAANNGRLIALARNALPRLLREIRERRVEDGKK